MAASTGGPDTEDLAGAPPTPQSAAPGQPNASNPAPVIPLSKQEPPRILGIMPNYRAVSAGAIPPPPTPRQAFKIATQNSFDSSAFLFAGIPSLLAWGNDTHPPAQRHCRLRPILLARFPR